MPNRRVALAALAVVVAMAAVVLVWWQPWEGAARCVDDGANVVDAEAGLCYAVPEGLSRSAEVDLRDPFTSGLQTGEGTGLIFVGRVPSEFADEDVEAVARLWSERPALVGFFEVEVRSEASSIDGRDAAIAIAASDSAGADADIYVHVTVVDLGDGMAVLQGITTTEPGDDGLIAVIESVHDSIAIV